MARWQDIVDSAPDFAAEMQRQLNEARNRLVIRLWRPVGEIRRFERD